MQLETALRPYFQMARTGRLHQSSTFFVLQCSILGIRWLWVGQHLQQDCFPPVQAKAGQTTKSFRAGFRHVSVGVPSATEGKVCCGHGHESSHCQCGDGITSSNSDSQKAVRRFRRICSEFMIVSQKMSALKCAQWAYNSRASAGYTTALLWPRSPLDHHKHISGPISFWELQHTHLGFSKASTNFNISTRYHQATLVLALFLHLHAFCTKGDRKNKTPSVFASSPTLLGHCVIGNPQYLQKLTILVERKDRSTPWE